MVIGTEFCIFSMLLSDVTIEGDYGVGPEIAQEVRRVLQEYNLHTICYLWGEYVGDCGVITQMYLSLIHI